MDAEKEISKINDESLDTEMKRRQHIHKLKLEQAMQTARMQAQQQTQANQNGHIQRVSMKAMLEKKKEVVRKNDEQKRSAISQEHDDIQRKKRQTSL